MSIGGMGPDAFERFMCDLLPRIYPGFEHLEPSFNAMGKATRGRCDAYLYHGNDDSYMAILCSTKQERLQAKVLEEIAKLAGTKFAAKIRRVILCVNTPIKDEVEIYRAACGRHSWVLDAISLERITRHVLGHSDLLAGYFRLPLPLPLASEADGSGLRRFDCGPRLREARDDLGLLVSELIERIAFHSEREWKSIEAGELDVSERFIESFSALSGVSSAWIKHGVGTKYPVDTIYDFDELKIDAIANGGFLATYMAVEPESMALALVVQISEFNWRVVMFGFCLDFFNWLDDHYHVPRIFELLLRADKLLKHPYGRVISKELMAEMEGGMVHPLLLLQKAGGHSYWFEDLFDLFHRRPGAADKYIHHGYWFVKLQDEFRRALPHGPAATEVPGTKAGTRK